jgi:hypothetical protein
MRDSAAHLTITDGSEKSKHKRTSKRPTEDKDTSKGKTLKEKLVKEGKIKAQDVFTHSNHDERME